MITTDAIWVEVLKLKKLVAGLVTGTGGGSGMTQLTGDVTAGPGSGSQAATIPNGTVTYAKMQDVSATSRVLGRKTAGSGDVEELTLSEVLDFIGSAAQGDILYRGAGSWARLGAGSSGQFLKTNGTGANPAWATVSGSGGPVGSVVTAYKPSDTSRNTTISPTDDPDLTLAVNANEWFIVDYTLLLVGAAAGDFKFGFSYPSGCTILWAMVSGSSRNWQSATTTAGGLQLLDETQTLGVGATSGGVITGGLLHAVVKVGGTGGTVALQWSQDSSNGTDSTLKAGSALIATRIK